MDVPGPSVPYRVQPDKADVATVRIVSNVFGQMRQWGMNPAMVTDERLWRAMLTLGNIDKSDEDTMHATFHAIKRMRDASLN